MDQNKLQIIHVDTPKFEYEGVYLYVVSKMYKNLIEFQAEIDERGKMGFTKCFLYSIYTQHEPDFVIYWVRYKFVK